jgi:DNA repair protein RadC
VRPTSTPCARRSRIGSARKVGEDQYRQQWPADNPAHADFDRRMCMGITDWSEGERPRERLVREGAAALSNPELLALLLRVGVRGKSAVELGRDILQHFGSLHGLFGATLDDCSEVHGLGMAKYAQLQAVMELARRAIAEQLQAGETFGSPELVKRYLRMKLGGQRHESFVVLFLDVKNRLIADKEMFRGTLSHTSVYPREVVVEALARNAAGVILAHNHPLCCIGKCQLLNNRRVNTAIVGVN